MKHRLLWRCISNLTKRVDSLEFEGARHRVFSRHQLELIGDALLKYTPMDHKSETEVHKLRAHFLEEYRRHYG